MENKTETKAEAKRTRFNFLDVLIIMAVLALIAGIMWRQELTEKIEIRDSQNTVTVNCEFELVDTADAVAQYGARFEEGTTPVYMDGLQIGVVEKTVSTVNTDSSADGEPISVETLLLKLTVVSNPSGYYLENGTKLFLGGQYRLHTKTQDFAVEITGIKGR